MDVKKELEQIQDKIENAKNPMLKSYLLLKKIDLLKVLEAQKSVQELINEKYKKVIDQLEWDLKNDNKI